MQGMAQGQNILLKRTNTFGITGRYLELLEENLRYCPPCEISTKTPTFTHRHCLSGFRRILSVVFWVWMNLCTLENGFRSGLFPCTYAMFLGAQFPLRWLFGKNRWGLLLNLHDFNDSSSCAVIFPPGKIFFHFLYLCCMITRSGG